MRAAGAAPPDRRALDLSIAEQCRLNLVRLTVDMAGEHALSVSAPALSMAPALAAYYRRVDDVSGLADAVMEQGEVAGRYDGVAMYGHRPTAQYLSSLRRRMATGAWLLVGADNAWSPVRRSGASRATRAGLCGQVRAAGFNGVRAYWVEPSLAVPRQFIPATRHAVASFEAWRGLEQPSGALRRCFVAAGWHEVLYPAIVVVATA